MALKYSRNHEEAIESDINLAPIIDCFTVLIAFLLASSSFISIDMLNTSVDGAGSRSVASTDKGVSLTFNFRIDGSVEATAEGTKKFKEVISKNADGSYNFEALTAKALETIGEAKDSSQVILSADNTVEFDTIIKGLEVLKKADLSVVLGGL